MKFYDCATAPSPRRARMVIAEKRIDVETVEVDLRSGQQFSEDFRTVNPGCTVPVLVTDEGERNGHHLQNRSDADCVFLAIGSRSDEDAGEYPDIDLRVRPGRYSKPAVFTNKRDEPY